MKPGKFQEGLLRAHKELCKKPVVSTVYLLLRFMVIVVMIAQFYNRNFENVFLCSFCFINSSFVIMPFTSS